MPDPDSWRAARQYREASGRITVEFGGLGSSGDEVREPTTAHITFRVPVISGG